MDRLKLIKDAGVDERGIASAVFEEVNVRLQNIFGFQLRRAPKYFIPEKKDSWFPKNVKDRYYLINVVQDAEGQHAKALYTVHAPSSMDKGLLMTVLGFIFCKGDARSDNSRWLLDKELYRLLHVMDENLPPEPPVPGSTRPPSRVEPDVDAALDRFVKMDYLIRVKANEQLLAMNEHAEDTSCFYAMGARAAIEIGRKQVVHFLAQTRRWKKVLLSMKNAWVSSCVLTFAMFFISQSEKIFQRRCWMKSKTTKTRWKKAVSNAGNIPLQECCATTSDRNKRK